MSRLLFRVLAVVLLLPLFARADSDEDLVNGMLARIQELKRSARANGDLSDPKKTDAFQQQLSKIIEDTLPKLSPKSRAGMTISLKMMQPLHDEVTAYVKLVDEFSSSDEARFTTIKDRAEIPPRVAHITRLSNANDNLTNKYRGLRDEAKALLDKSDISSSDKTGYLTAFDEGFGRTVGPTMAIRELDRKLYGEWTAALQLLDRSWGQWKVNDKQQIEWTDDGGRARFNEIMENIHVFTERQQRAQELLINRG
ncbi:MAG TPA: hypothetical protein VHD32_13200 [Candidatus Didemnitutus sp.]|nr:hypothetical protein [Candidatus Didemnitutus sp.]